MKKFFHTHPDIVIATLAVVFIGVTVSFYLWAIDSIYTEVHRALTAATPQISNSFDLQSAANLDLRGLTVNTSSVPSATTNTGTPTSAPSDAQGTPASTGTQ